jgi:glutamate synthase (NADPH/NADH) large chain
VTCHTGSTKNINLDALLFKQPTNLDVALYKQEEQNHYLDDVLDRKLIEVAQPALQSAESVYAEFPVQNIRAEHWYDAV